MQNLVNTFIIFDREYLWEHSVLIGITFTDSILLFCVWSLFYVDEDEDEDESDLDTTDFNPDDDLWIIAEDRYSMNAFYYWEEDVVDTTTACEFVEPICDVDDDFFYFFINNVASQYDYKLLRTNRFFIKDYFTG